jgi:hypothetical protein
MRKQILLTLICITINNLYPKFYPNEFLQENFDNPNTIKQTTNEAHKELATTFSILPKEVQQETKRVVENIKNNSIDTREWYQKKRYWALISTATICGGAAGGYGTAKLIALANVSQTTAAMATLAAGTTTGVATGAVTVYAISEYKGYEIKIVKNGVYITKKEQK